MRGTKWLPAAAVLLVSNALLLGLAAFDRAGSPQASLRVTERELPFRQPRDRREDRTVRLEWEQRRDWFREGPGWFDVAKLRSLGFDCSVPAGSPAAALHYAKALPRRAYVVLEFEGEAWEEWAARQSMELNALAGRVDQGEFSTSEYRSAQDAFLRARQGRSRLFVVDAGPDPKVLRDRFPDRDRNLVLQGTARLLLRRGRSGPYLAGEVGAIEGEELHLPEAALDFLRTGGADSPLPGPYWTAAPAPRYRVTLRSGRLHRPRIEKVELP